MNVAAWAGLRAAKLAGMQVGDVDLPVRSLNPNARPKPGTLRVERTVTTIDGQLVYDTPKTRGSRRRVPLTPATVDLLRNYLARHPRHDEPTAPLFPAGTLVAQKPTGLKAVDATGKRIVPKAEDALAALTVDEAQARLTLDWHALLRHLTLYKAVYRLAVLRANPTGAGLATRAQVPRAATHLRQSVRGCGHPAVGAGAVHGARQGDHHAQCLRAPIRRRSRRRDGCARCNGPACGRKWERGAAKNLGNESLGAV